MKKGKTFIYKLDGRYFAIGEYRNISCFCEIRSEKIEVTSYLRSAIKLYIKYFEKNNYEDLKCSEKENDFYEMKEIALDLIKKSVEGDDSLCKDHWCYSKYEDWNLFFKDQFLDKNMEIEFKRQDELINSISKTEEFIQDYWE